MNIQFPNKDEAINRIMRDHDFDEGQALEYFNNLVSRVHNNMLLSEYTMWNRMNGQLSEMKLDHYLTSKLTSILLDKLYHYDFPNITIEEFWYLYDKRLFTLFCKKTNRTIVSGKELFSLTPKEHKLIKILKTKYT